MNSEPLPARRSPIAPCSAERAGEGREQQTAELTPGTLLAGKYRIKAVLGRGGFATVYDAEHLALGRDVALKVLHRTDCTPQVLIERFAREVRISALVRHPNLLEVYDAGALDDGSPFLVMEKIAGPTLHDELCRVHRLDIEQTIDLASQLLVALVAIAAQGIIHRDIKPENLMLARAPDGAVRLKLVDFGIALVRAERITARLTAHGALIGTPQYMAPEQLRSEIADARVDLYAAGVVMYQALTGALPHDAADLSSLTLMVLNGKWRPLRAQRPDCPRRLARLIERALAPDPGRRFASAARMLAELEACRAELPCARQPQAGMAAARARLLPRSSLARAGLALLALMLAGALQTGVAAAFRRGLAGTSQADAALVRRAADVAAQPARGVPAVSASSAAAADHHPPARAGAADLGAQPVAIVDALPPQEVVQLPAGAVAEQERGAPDRTNVAAPEQLSRARALLRKGLSLYLHAEIHAAYATYRKASQLAPQEPAAFRALGMLASQLGRTQEARRAFARYLALAPQAADGPLIRARMRALNQSADESELVQRGEPARDRAPVAARTVL